jgi:dihydroflavonol-4-reductase
MESSAGRSRPEEDLLLCCSVVATGRSEGADPEHHALAWVWSRAKDRRAAKEIRLMVTVVTGASGFLGGVLVRDLLVEGRSVRAFDLRRGQGLDGLDIEWMQGDVLDPSSLRPAMDGADSVFHLAAVISVTGDPTGRVWKTNVTGVRNTAVAALEAGVRRFVHCSSIHAYDIAAGGPITEESPRAENPSRAVYDRSKAAGESALRDVISSGLDGVICNPTAVIGPGDFTHSRMNTVLEAMFEQRLPALISGGFDWVDVRDVAASLIAAERAGRPGENYLLPGHHLSVRELADVVEVVTSIRVPRITVPMWFARLWSPIANTASRRSESPLWYTTEALNALRSNPKVASTKARTQLGHTPRSMEDTISDLYTWTRALPEKATRTLGWEQSLDLPEAQAGS